MKPGFPPPERAKVTARLVEREPEAAEPQFSPIAEPSTAKYGDWAFRLVIVLMLIGAISAAWWSLRYKLAPLQAQSRELMMKAAKLSLEVDELERKWAKPDADRIKANLRAAHSQLFANEVELANWLEALKAKIEPLALNAKAEFGHTLPQNTGEEELAIIPTTIAVNVHPTPGAAVGETAYQRLLRLSQALTAQQHRADLAELRVNGGTNSVASAVMVFHLWAGEGAQ